MSIDQVVAMATEMGGAVAAVLKPAIAHQHRAERIDHRLRELRAVGERESGAVTRAIAEGELEPDEAARPADTWVYDSRASKRLVAASAGARNLYETTVVRSAPQLFEALQQVCADVVAESVRLVAKSLPRDVSDREAAYSAGTDAFDAWMKLGRCVEVWVKAHRLARELRSAGFVEGPENNARVTRRADAYTLFLHPGRLVRGWWTAAMPEELKLASAAASGAGPGLHSWPDAVHRLRLDDRRAGRFDDPPMTTVHHYATRQDQALNMPIVTAAAEQAIRKPHGVS